MSAFAFGADTLATAANDSSPEGFSMRAGVQRFLPARRAARVDKPRKEEAARAWDQAMGKEHRRVRRTLPQARRRPCWVCQLQLFSATLIAGVPWIGR